MNQRFLCGVLLLTVGCSADTNSGSNAPDGGAGNSPGGSGNGGAAGQQGTGATSTGNTPGGGGATGNGGSGTGIGGSGPGNGGSGTGNGGSSIGGGGATGTGGTAGAGMGGGAGTGGQPADTGESVLERNKHANRDGFFIQPTLTAAAAAKMSRDTAFAPKFTGQMFASPLYLQNGPGGKGVFFAVTTANDVMAFDETTGATVWTKNIGAPATGVGCGIGSPLGIISTPVIDATSRTIYVAAAVSKNSAVQHQVDAFSVDDGTEKPGYPVVVSGTSGSTTFTAAPQNQRSALSLVKGTLYVAYGGYVGDCGNYHGWVVGINTADPTQHGGWASLGKGEGIWASGGMASDGNGVFAVTGNSTAGVADHMASDSEEVVRVTGLGVLDRSNQNLFFPASWHSMDSGDQDLGSASPVYISVPGATPANLVAAASKDGHLYLLDPANLGGMAGFKTDFVVANGSNTIHTALGSYTTAKGRYVTLGTDSGGKCPAGGASGRVVMGIHIPAGSPPTPEVTWCATSAGGVPGPIATSTDGTANAIVWYMSGSTLMGVDGDTGKTVYSGTGANGCNNVQHWTSLIAAKGRIVSPSDGTLCSWSSK